MLFTTLQHAFLLVYLSPTIRYYLKYAAAPYPLSLPFTPSPFHLPLPPWFTPSPLPFSPSPPSPFPLPFHHLGFDPPSSIRHLGSTSGAIGGLLVAGSSWRPIFPLEQMALQWSHTKLLLAMNIDFDNSSGNFPAS